MIVGWASFCSGAGEVLRQECANQAPVIQRALSQCVVFICGLCAVPGLLISIDVAQCFSKQGRVRVVLNPSRYEIPSGSAYGYIIADNAEQARRRMPFAIDFAQWAIKHTVKW